MITGGDGPMGGDSAGTTRDGDLTRRTRDGHSTGIGDSTNSVKLGSTDEDGEEVKALTEGAEGVD